MAKILGGEGYAYCLKQADYIDIETEPFQWEGITFYHSLTKDWLGYHDFPVTTEGALSRVELRGKGIADGFRIRKKDSK